MCKQADVDRCVIELYQDRAQHRPGCGAYLSLADMLRQRCPHCDAYLWGQGLAPEVTPERALAMLAELQARRAVLALAQSVADGMGADVVLLEGVQIR